MSVEEQLSGSFVAAETFRRIVRDKERLQSDDHLQNPTAADVLNVLTQIGAKAKSGDLVVVFFCCHGSALENKTIQLPPAGKPVVSPTTLPENDEVSLELSAGTAIFGKDINAVLSGFQRGTRVVLCTDACNSGTIDDFELEERRHQFSEGDSESERPSDVRYLVQSRRTWRLRSSGPTLFDVLSAGDLPVRGVKMSPVTNEQAEWYSGACGSMFSVAMSSIYVQQDLTHAPQSYRELIEMTAKRFDQFVGDYKTTSPILYPFGLADQSDLDAKPFRL